MKTSFYAIFNKRGYLGIRVNKPVLSSGQICVKMQVEIADEFFDRTIPEVNIEVPSDYIQKPDVKVELKEGVMDKLIGDEENEDGNDY